MTTQTAKKGEPGHIPELRERTGSTPKQRRRVIYWTWDEVIRVTLPRERKHG